MKKMILGAAMLFAAVAFGQEEKAMDVDFGGKAGLNLASFSGDNDGTEGTVGFYAGLFAEFDLSDKFQIQPELLYSQEGAKLEGDVDGDDPQFSYIRVPIMAKYMIAEGLDVLAGPQFGFMIDDKDYEDINSFDFGLGAGLSYEFDMGLNIEARYNLGLTNLIDVDGADLKQNNLMLGVGYEF